MVWYNFVRFVTGVILGTDIIDCSPYFEKCIGACTSLSLYYTLITPWLPIISMEFTRVSSDRVAHLFSSLSESTPLFSVVCPWKLTREGFWITFSRDRWWDWWVTETYYYNVSKNIPSWVVPFSHYHAVNNILVFPSPARGDSCTDWYVFVDFFLLRLLHHFKAPSTWPTVLRHCCKERWWNKKKNYSR